VSTDSAFYGLLCAPLIHGAASSPEAKVMAPPAMTAARRFIAAYQSAGGSVPHQQTLVWYTSLHALRILT
jgi:hypothetical protein